MSAIAEYYSCADCCAIFTKEAFPLHSCIGSQVSQDEESTPDLSGGTVRWTASETKQLFKAYKKHLKELILVSSNRKKRQIWKDIASEVKMTKPRKCDPYMARMKMENMKKTWRRCAEGGSRGKWIFHDQMSKIMNLEVQIQGEIVTNGIETVLEQPLLSSLADGNDSSEDESELAISKNKANEEIPAWYEHFKWQAKKRHDQKMKMYNRFVDLLEKVVEGDLAFDV